MNKINLLVIGCGRHAKRIYLPLIKKYSKEYNIELKGIIDIEDKKILVLEYLTELNIICKKLFIKNFKLTKDYKLTFGQKRLINEFIIDKEINSVIISSDPNSHKAYALWALEKGFNILMDKPITIRNNSSFDYCQAKKIISDFEEIKNLYQKKLIENKKLIFSCMAQRRYHPAMQKIKEEIKIGIEKTNCPITSITILHSDGQWRMPNEILYEKYHGFNEGIGKCSHSGYHFFDMIAWFLDDKLPNNKKIDSVKIFSNFLRPSDFLSQITYEDYANLFKSDFKNNTPKKYLKDIEKSKRLGEIDAFINFAFLSKNRKITNANLSLIHNGFSVRSWFFPKKDLYKGNGRVRHEVYIIEQGPFQSIHYHSYQSGQIIEKKSKNSEIGQEFHSEVLIFRNPILNMKPFEKINFGKTSSNDLKGYSRGHQEEARGNCFLEFIKGSLGLIKNGDIKSSICDHKRGVILMSGAYISATRELKGKNPFIKLKYNPN